MPISTVELAGRQVGKVGLGLMQLTWTHQPVSDSQAFDAMRAALDAGATTWSSATFYGNPPGGDGGYDNLRLLGRFFQRFPEYIGKVQLVVKGGLGEGMAIINDLEANRAMLIRARDCLQGVPIDVYLPARVAPGSDPVEFFKPFDGLRREGLFSALGASEVSASTLRALEEAGIPISVIEIEVSLWCFDDKVKDVIAYSDESKIPVYAYSPLGRGFLTRTWKTPEDIPAGSMQAHLPRFQGENFYHNIKLVDVLDDLAVAKGLTTAQLAIAWVCNLGRYTIPIPGSSNRERARQNVEAANILLTDADLQQIGDVLAKFDPKGGRYPAGAEAILMV